MRVERRFEPLDLGIAESVGPRRGLGHEVLEYRRHARPLSRYVMRAANRITHLAEVVAVVVGEWVGG